MKIPKKIKEFLSHLPILLFKDIPDVIIEEDKGYNVSVKKLIMTSLCDLPNFNVNINSFFTFLDTYKACEFFDRMDGIALKWIMPGKIKVKIGKKNSEQICFLK